MICKIISRYRVVYEGVAEYVSIPTISGEVGILENHIRMYSKLDDGIIRVRTAEGELEFTSTGGILQVLPKEIRILVDSSENVDDIDEARAQQAYQRAKDAVAEAAAKKDTSEFAKASHSLRKSQLRLSAVRRRARLHSGFKKIDPLK